MLPFLLVSVVLGHNGVVHDQTSGCPASIFAGSNTSEGYFALDWQAQRLYLKDNKIKHSWKLPDSYWYAITEHDDGALISIGNATANFTVSTENDEDDFGIVTWTPTNGVVHKLRKHNQIYYGLDILTGVICQFNESMSCNDIVSTTPSTFVQDKDYVKTWSFAINGTIIYVIGSTGIKYTTDFGSTWNNIDFDVNNVNTYSDLGQGQHVYGDIFYHESTGRLIAVTGENCYACEHAQLENNVGKVVVVLPERRVLAVGLRHPYMSALIHDLLIIGDVGEAMYEELNVMNVMETEIINFMWPLYEGHASNHRHFSYYGGTPRLPNSVLKHCPSKLRAYGAYASFASGAVIIIITLYMLPYKKMKDGQNRLERIHVNQLFFQLAVVVAIMAPVWFGSEYGYDYHEGIVYYVEDGDLATYNPSITEYTLYAFFTIGGCLFIYPLLAHIIIFVSAVLVLVVKERNYPFYIEWAFVVPFFIIVVASFSFEIYKSRSTSNSRGSQKYTLVNKEALSFF